MNDHGFGDCVAASESTNTNLAFWNYTCKSSEFCMAYEPILCAGFIFLLVIRQLVFLELVIVSTQSPRLSRHQFCHNHE